jgi:hypothetical protein
MLRSLAELGIAFVELAEAEGKRLASGTKKTAAAVAGMVIVATVAGATLAVGTGLLVWALYALLAGYFVMPAALALTGLAVWLVVGGGAWLAITAMRRKS